MAPVNNIVADLRFQSPFGMYVSGPTTSGKSSFVFELLKNYRKVFNPVPTRVVYAYAVWQDSFNVFKNVEFVCGSSSVLENGFFNPKIDNLLIVDDLMEEISNNKAAAALFTRGIHHQNISVIFISQNMFKQGKSMRDIVLNCQYFVLMNSPRDVQQIQYLARQTGLKHLGLTYPDVIKEP